MEPRNQTPAQTPADPINLNDTPRIYSIKLLTKMKLITKISNWTYQSDNNLKWPKPYFGKLYWKCNSFFYFDSSPIHLHGEGGVYDLYCSQPPGGDQRARSFTFQDMWGWGTPGGDVLISRLVSFPIAYLTAVKPAAVQKNTVKPAAIEIMVREYYYDYGNVIMQDQHRGNALSERFSF